MADLAAPRPTVLHLGAHKTATTHLQFTLARSRDRLVAAGLGLFLPADLRAGGLRLHGWLNRDSGGSFAGARLRAAFRQPAQRMLLSDENVLGGVPGADLAEAGRLYPNGPARLARLLTLLPPGPVTLALAVREGAGFLASCHSQALMAGRVAPFERVFGGVDPAALSWADLAQRLLEAAPGARLLVWDHADWARVQPRVAAALLGPDAPALRWKGGRTHQGLSAAAVARLLAEAPADPADAARLAGALRARLGKGAGHAAYDPWPEAQRPAIRAGAARALASDLDLLARNPRVTVIRAEPGPDPAAG